jgi:hypothetical protein
MSTTASERISVAPKVKMLTTLRSSGYNNNSAIGDILDNSIDAGAQNIWIDINSKNEIRISDDASGMSETRLVEAMTMGSETDKNNGTTLGRFGFGMKTASLSLGRRLTVITKEVDGEIVTAVHDLDNMTAAQEIFVDVHRGVSHDHYRASFTSHTRKSNKGTVVVIDKIDQLSNPNIPAYRGVLKSYVSEVFRNFINEGLNIYLNTSRIEAADIMLEKHGGEVYSDRDYAMPYLDESGKQKSTIVRVQYNQGLYIMRNNRQIIRGNMQWLGLVKNSWYNRFRGEIYLSGELDKTVGIDFQKMETSNIRKSFEGRIQAIVKPGFDAIQAIIRNQMMDALVEDEAREDQYRKIEEDINAHYDEVKKYKPEAEKSDVVEPADEEEKESKPEREDQPLPTPRKSKNKRLIETCNARLGADGVICDYEFKPDGVLRLTWNVDHKFYADFLANRDYETVGAMVKLFAATARTQARLLMATDEERAKIEEYNQFISDEVGLFMSEPRRKKGNHSPLTIETEHDSITFLP